MKKILLIGGGGYIGVEITKYFLSKNKKVICYDNFLYENDFSVNSFLKDKNYELVKGDLNDKKLLSNYLNVVSDVILLAGMVGDPITAKYPSLAKKINEDGIINLIDFLSDYQFNKLVFISTCSNYGFINEDVYADENHSLEPLSIYAKSKVKIENYILSKKNLVKFSPVILRFATAFGLSKRMRFDLTINEFTQTLLNGNELLVYDADTWRPYCHVLDFAQIIFKVINIEKTKTDFQVYNVGNDKNNYTKRNIVNKILKFIPNAKVTYRSKGNDPRNYKVNFNKLYKELDIKANISIDTGIKEIIDYYGNSVIDIKNKLYGNYHINET